MLTLQAAPLFAGGTLRFERTVIAVFGSCAIAPLPIGGLPPIPVQFFTCRTEVDIAFDIIAEAGGRKELGALVESRKRHVRADVLAFNGDDVLFGAVLALPGGLFGPQLPADRSCSFGSRNHEDWS
jgi:hypothetical protein